MNEQFRFNSVLLNAELHSASTFIYDACLDILALEKNIQDMEAKLFNIFYKISIGIERFQKIIGVLNINPSSQEDLQNNCDKLFYKHSHQVLGDKIEKDSNYSTSKKGKRLLDYLQIFYNKHRYGYFSFQENNNMTFNLLLEFAKISKTSEIEKNTTLTDALSVFKESLSELIKIYVEIITEESRAKKYFTIESESHTKWFAIYYYKNKIFSVLSQREIAIKTLLLDFIKQNKTYSSFVDEADYLDHINDIISGGTCSLLIEQVSEEFCEKDINIDEFSQNELNDLIAKIDHCLSNNF